MSIGNFKSIGPPGPTQDAGRFYLISISTLIVDSIDQPPQYKSWGKERIAVMMLRLMTFGRGVVAV